MKSYRFFKIYSLIISLLFVYILLDIFVIPTSSVTVETSNSDAISDEDKNITESNTNTYQDDNITIKITTLREYDTNIYIADVVINNISYLKTALANNTYGKNITATTSSIAESNNAILAINGDYYGFRTSGYVVRNGITYRSTSNGTEDLVIYNDGTFAIIDESTTSLSSLTNVLQVFSFGPALINNSNIAVSTSEEVAQSMTSNPRTAIGIINPLHYILVVSDGRTTASSGLTLYELAQVMSNLGCTVAYNLDGGGSSTMYFNGNIINNPTTNGNSISQRKVSDIVYVGY